MLSFISALIRFQALEDTFGNDFMVDDTVNFLVNYQKALNDHNGDAE